MSDMSFQTELKSQFRDCNLRLDIMTNPYSTQKTHYQKNIVEVTSKANIVPGTKKLPILRFSDLQTDRSLGQKKACPTCLGTGPVHKWDAAHGVPPTTVPVVVGVERLA